MNQVLSDVVNNTGMNVHYPFHGYREGQSRESMAADMDRLQAAGIDGFIGCVRSSQYMGSSFWKDMDIMIDELQKRDMHFFIQDEQGFPSGEANGWIRTRAPEKAKLFIDHRHVDVAGPMKGASVPIGAWLDPHNHIDMLQAAIEQPQEGAVGMAAFDGSLNRGPRYPMGTAIRVIALKHSSDGKTYSDPVDVTDCFDGKWLYWDIPEGSWRIVILFRTTKSTGRQFYINMIDDASVRVFIDALYEPMWERYQEHFGKTFMGFFTDEPEFGNCFGYAPKGIGKSDEPLPWSDELEAIIEKEMGSDVYLTLPALWMDFDPAVNARVRVQYMDLITRLYAKNFTGQIGRWCQDHGVIYTGHLVEDMGNHTRLGCGAGHFFRAESGQTMAGIDLIDNQLLPGCDNPVYRGGVGTVDGEEMTYALAKLAASASYLDEKKQGRSLCETASSSTLKHFKWVCDNLVSRGINQMMPNYREGGMPMFGRLIAKNPQYRYFPMVTAYLTRACKLHRGGYHRAPVAVLYHAEAEWAGGGYMNCARPIKVMNQNQIDCTIIPADVFTMTDFYHTRMLPGELKVNTECFKALVIPYSEYITKAVAEAVDALSIPVCFVDAAPSFVIGGGDLPINYEVVALEDVAVWLRAKGAFEVEVSCTSKGLYVDHYINGGLDIYMLFNESFHETVDTVLTVPSTGQCVVYDAMANVFFDAQASEAHSAGTAIPVKLAPYETAFVIFAKSEELEGIQVQTRPVYTEGTPVPEGVWQLFTATGDQYPDFVPAGETDLVNMGAPDRYQELYGTLRYERTIELPEDTRAIDLGDVYESAELFVNGRSAGVRLAWPYVFEVADLIRPGTSRITVEVTGGYRSLQNQTLMFEPFGLLGPVKVLSSRTTD